MFARSIRGPQLIVLLPLLLLPLNSAFADGIGTRVQAGHFGIDGQAHDYNPPYQTGTWSRSYPYGSISATAGTGTLSVVGSYSSPDINNNGNADLKMNSYFADTVTIDAPGQTGQPGTFTVAYVFDGSYDANEYFDTYVSVNCDFGIDAGDGTIPDMNSAAGNGFSYRGNDTYSFGFGATLFLGEEQTQTLAFTFGQPFDFWMKLGARLHITESEPGDVRVAVSLVKWTGLNNITAGGLPVTNATVSSISETNWTQAVTSSLPATTNQTQIAQIVLTPTSIILRGTNGAAHGPYKIVTSSNLLSIVETWLAISTGRYDAGGGFDTTNSISPTNTQGFFRVQ